MKKIISFLTIRAFMLLWSVSLVGPSIVRAQDIPGADPPTVTNNATGGLVNPLKGISTLDEFLKAILDGVIQIGTLVLIMMLVYVGFLFVVARGNPEKIQGAKSALVWTVIGGLVLLGATAIQLVISGTVKSITS